MKKKRYSREFKFEAVRLLESSDQTGDELAKELGVKRNQLYKWREEFIKKGDAAFQGPGRKPASQDDELTRLKKENERLQEENDILKKAAIFFAKELD